MAKGLNTAVAIRQSFVSTYPGNVPVPRDCALPARSWFALFRILPAPNEIVRGNKFSQTISAAAPPPSPIPGQRRRSFDDEDTPIPPSEKHTISVPSARLLVWNKLFTPNARPFAFVTVK